MTDPRDQPSGPMAHAAPLFATAVLALLLLADDPLVAWHTATNWPWWFGDLEHFGSAWCNRILPWAALLVAFMFDRRALRQLIVALPLQAIWTHLLKWLVGRVRPIHGDEAMLFSPLSPTHESWPSGHAALVWTIAFVFAFRRSRTTAIWILLALYVSWARLHTYAHFPSDVFSGALLGGIVAFVTGATLKAWIDSGQTTLLRGSLTPPWRLGCLWLTALICPIVIAIPFGRRLSPVDSAAARQSISALYNDYLGREADAPGLAAYTAQRLDGLPLLAIARDILDSDESRRRLALLAPEQRVARLYELLLHREPTAKELAHDTPLAEDLSRRRSRLPLLIMRLTWQSPGRLHE